MCAAFAIWYLVFGVCFYFFSVLLLTLSVTCIDQDRKNERESKSTRGSKVPAQVSSLEDGSSVTHGAIQEVTGFFDSFFLLFRTKPRCFSVSPFYYQFSVRNSHFCLLATF